MIKIFIGYDTREIVAHFVCLNSIIKHSKQPISVTPRALQNLPNYQEVHTDGSNQFIYSRFLVPYLMNFKGWAIYLDGDMLLRAESYPIFTVPGYTIEQPGKVLLTNWHPTVEGISTVYAALFVEYSLIAIYGFVLPKQVKQLRLLEDLVDEVYTPMKNAQDSSLEVAYDLKRTKCVNLWNVKFPHDGVMELLNTALNTKEVVQVIKDGSTKIRFNIIPLSKAPPADKGKSVTALTHDSQCKVYNKGLETSIEAATQIQTLTFDKLRLMAKLGNISQKEDI